MTILKKGMNGEEVLQLQLALKAACYDPGDIDGIFGDLTENAVILFQTTYASLTIDGIAGPHTLSKLAQATLIKAPPPAEVFEPVQEPNLSCELDLWLAFNKMVTLITGHPIKYGPGRGLFVDGEFVITYGPGKLDYKDWKTRTPPPYPSFHCSSWTNFFLGWVSGRNADYTHSGNIPSLFQMCEQSPDLQDNGGLAKYRGYNDVCKQFKSNGASRGRTGIGDSRVVDLLELWDRRQELPTFFVCGQSTKKSAGGWKWWHHTVLFIIDHRTEGHPMYRVAADGFKDSSGRYSGTVMRYQAVDRSYAVADGTGHVYRGYTVHPPTGLVAAPVVIEQG